MFFENLETERLELKNIASDDREFILKQFSDEDVNEFLYDEEPFSTLEEADGLIEFYNENEPRNQHRWILVLKENGEKIGTCGFHCWDRESGYVELGYDLQKNYWGKGLMSEALNAILPLYTKKMGAVKVAANIYVDNKRSINLAEKQGFVFEGDTTMFNFRGKDYLHNVYVLHCKKI